jgi:D-3-phosphoglycerate dehydrogenase
MLDAARMAKAKKGVRIINCARGGLVDEAALFDALKSGQVGGAALDVYETEPPPADFPLRDLPNIVFTPHLGASTAEAQESVGIEIAQAIRAALLHGEIRNAVNMPTIDAKTLEIIGPYLLLGEKLGRLLSQIAPKRCERLNINYSGKVAEVDTAAVTRAVLKGYLLAALGAEVNQVNAPALATNLGLKVTESRVSAPGDFTELIELSAGCNGEAVSVAGTYFGPMARVVKINNRHVEARPEGVLLIIQNRDRPGIVGMLGSVLGASQVNIAGMSLSRNDEGGQAITVLNLDTAPSDEVLEKLLAEEDIHSARVISL